MSMIGGYMRGVVRLAVAAMAAVLPVAAAVAQQPTPAGAGARVQATVYDSLSRRPLSQAVVQVVSASDPTAFVRTGETDSLGSVAFDAVPVGRYRVGFMHPVLDELGIAAPQRELVVAAAGPVRVELAVPSATRVRAALCGSPGPADSSAALVGTVRDPAELLPLAGASVTAEWLAITFGGNGLRQRVERATAVTGGNGWFALCGLPAGTVMIQAGRGADSTPRLELQLQPQEFRQRDLIVGAAGRGQLRGRVVTADSGRPLAGARVIVAGATRAVTDARGEWSAGELPMGTQMMEVRAVGYYPERRPVDVVAAAPRSEVALSTFSAVLDAVRVTADRAGAADLGGFVDRQRRSGMGRYLTAEQIARRNLLETSDLLRTMPGFVGDGSLTMRGNFSDGAGNYGIDCQAEVYIDGHLMRGLTAAELDAIVKPENILGVEVYASGSPKPPQFDSGMAGCGSLVIWQKPMGMRGRGRR